MTNWFSSIKVGMTMDELKDLVVKNHKTLDETVKTSIFNFIKDEEEIGDAKISNKGELQMLMNFIKGNKDMPPVVEAGDGAEVRDHVWGKDVAEYVSRSKGHHLLGGEFIEETAYYKGKKGKYFENASRIETSYEENGIFSYTLDTYIDNNSDGTLDRRVYQEGLYGEPTEYHDNNLDGTFETKKVYDESTKTWITYYRDDNDNWVRK